MTLKEINAAIRELRAEMKAAGVKRSSFMNGGHSPQSYRMNAEMFRLESLKKKAQETP